jgi:hypothetical protein
MEVDLLPKCSEELDGADQEIPIVSEISADWSQPDDTGFHHIRSLKSLRSPAPEFLEIVDPIDQVPIFAVQRALNLPRHQMVTFHCVVSYGDSHFVEIAADPLAFSVPGLVPTPETGINNNGWHIFSTT